MMIVRAVETKRGVGCDRIWLEIGVGYVVSGGSEDGVICSEYPVNGGIGGSKGSG